MVKTYFYIILILPLLLNGCTTKTLLKDTDNDGVFDIYDKCINTPFVELVDKTGCKLKR